MISWVILSGSLSLVGVVLGAVLFGERPPPPIYLPLIANTTPPTMAELDTPADPRT